jgi:hypothetical protein
MLRARIDSSRAGSSAMTRVRSASLYFAQRSISARLRPHPKHNPEIASTEHIFSHGLMIMILAR